MMKNIAAGAFAAICVMVGGSAVFWPQLIRELPVPHVPAPDISAEPSMRVLFVGDIMLDRMVAAHAEAVGDQTLFAGVRELFATGDAVVANLEGTITTNPSVSRTNFDILHFTFAPKYAPLLAQAGVRAVSLANNHSYDFGVAGYDETLKNISQAGIAYFGSPLNDRNLSTRLVINGQTLCLVGYMQLFDPDTTRVITELKNIRTTCDRVVVMAHWGVEYQHEPTVAQQEEAHAFIDAGADVVVGAHPHVVEPLEIYKNHAIFYSLGNFIFDQGWMPQVRRGAAVDILFGQKETTFSVTAINTYEQASIADATTTKAVLADVGLDSPTFVLEN